MGNVFAAKSKKINIDDYLKYKLSIRQLDKTFDLNIIDIKNHNSCKYIYTHINKPISFLQGINNKVSFYNNDNEVDFGEFKIDLSKHTIFKAPHPSPLGAWRGWFGSKHFSKTNAVLKSLNKVEINW